VFTPKNPVEFVIKPVLRVVVFEFATITFVVEIEFVVKTLPWVVTIAPIDAAVLTPTGPGMLVRFMVVAFELVT
jgi:hypothetical protein